MSHGSKVALILIAYIVFIFIVLYGIAAEAHYDGQADLATQQWYHGLTQPHTGMGCCDLADCHPVSARSGKAGWEVFVADKWRKIPAGIILTGHSNPTGSAVSCWVTLDDSDIEFFCFVPPWLF